MRPLSERSSLRNPIRVALAFAVWCGAIASVPVAAGAGIVAAPDELVAYSTRSEHGGQILLARADGSGSAGSLTSGTGLDAAEPAWSPSGDRVLFAGRSRARTTHDLYSIPVDGGPARRLTNSGDDERMPSWSSTGEIAFVRGHATKPQAGLMRMKADGSGVATILAAARGRIDSAPAWSPDGKQLVFASDRAGGYPRLYRVDRDGTGLTQPLTDGSCIDSNPAWSDLLIAFDRTCPAAEDKSTDIWTIELRAEGSVLSRVTVGTPEVDEFDPDWSADGQGLAYVVAPAGGRGAVHIQRPLGTAPMSLSGGGSSAFSPDWHHLPQPGGGACTLVGTTGPDILRSSAAGDIGCGMGGDDTFVASATGSDIFRGGAGTDTVDYSGPTPVVADLSGSLPGADTFSSIESLIGSSEADTLYGDGSDNVLRGGGGPDVLDGRAGSDTASYEGGPAATVDLGVSEQPGAGGDSLTSIESLIGSPGDDDLTGNGGSNRLEGGSGRDVLSGEGGGDFLIGGPGDDTFDGGPGTDTASYEAATSGVNASLGVMGPQDVGGPEGLDQLSGIEVLVGSAQRDVLVGGPFTSELMGGGGNDRLVAGTGAASVDGGAGNDTLEGGDSADRLIGGSGNDVLVGGASNDILAGGVGNDRSWGGAGNDVIDGGAGADSLSGGAGSDRLIGGNNSDKILAGSGNDRADGGEGADALYGEGGNDRLSGGSGGDVLTGGPGSDVLIGGAGNDTLRARDRRRDRLIGGGGRNSGSKDRVDPASGIVSARKERRARRLRRSYVAPGVTLTRIRDRRGPRRIFVLTMDPRRVTTLDVGLARERLSGFERTSSIARRHGAVAGVNGDFGLPSGRPAHDLARDAELAQSSMAHGYHFAASRGERVTYMGHRAVSLETIRSETGEVWPVRRLNDGRPGLGQISSYTPVAGSLEPTPTHSCSARLSSNGTRLWTSGQSKIQEDHSVLQVSCGAAALSRGSGTVISARPHTNEGRFIRSLSPGSTVRLGWSMGWTGITDALGGYPRLLRNGEITTKACAQSLCRRHPRTGVGVTRSGKILLVAVDGRRRRWSVGMTLVEFAHEMARLGAVDALNLDGGGSTTMVVRGKIVNRPSDRRERSISSSLLILPGPDRRESAPASLPEPSEQPASAGEDAVRDPGSTGGLLEALLEGAFEPPADLTGELERLAAALQRGAVKG